MTKVYKKNQSGYATFIVTFFLFILIFLSFAFLNFVFGSHRAAQAIQNSLSAKYLVEAGLERTIWQLNQDESYAGETETNFGAGQLTVTLSDVNGNSKQIISRAAVPSFDDPKAIVREVKATAAIDRTLVAFNYGVHVGQGGLTMSNNAIIEGNIYANGTIVGSSGNIVTGGAVSADQNGLIDSITSTVDMRANTLRNCTVGGNATYNTTSSCTFNGTETVMGGNYPPVVPFPLTDQQIIDWKAEAEAGGVTTGNVTISTGTSLGPQKIVGNLTVGNGQTLTLTGRVWVTGDFLMDNNSVLEIDPSYLDNSEVLMVDGSAGLNNNSRIDGSGTEGSYIILIVDSNKLTNGDPAVRVSNNANTALFYARNGLVYIANNAHLSGVTAYKVHMNNNAVLIYDFGLADTSFSSGPGAAWAYDFGTYISE